MHFISSITVMIILMIIRLPLQLVGQILDLIQE